MLVPFLLFGCDSNKLQNEEPVNETPIEISDSAEPTEDDDCINDADHFSQYVWGSALSPVCFSCHNAQGSAGASNLVLVSNAQPGYLETNRESLHYVASLSIEGSSLVFENHLV